jgi:hypothetical protein
MMASAEASTAFSHGAFTTLIGHTCEFNRHGEGRLSSHLFVLSPITKGRPDGPAPVVLLREEVEEDPAR